MTPKSLLDEIETFLALDGVEMSETAFGLSAMNDGKFIPELRAGRRLWPDTEKKVRDFIAARTPKAKSKSSRQQAAA